MVYMADTDDECARCETEPTDLTDDLTEHVIRFSTDSDPERAKLCAPCVRKIQEADNDVRSIT